MSMDCTMYEVELWLEALADIMQERLDPDADSGDVAAAGRVEQEAAKHLTATVQLRLEKTKHCPRCLHRHIKSWAWRYSDPRFQRDWAAWCDRAIGTAPVDACADDDDHHCTTPVDTLVYNTLNAYDAAVDAIACHTDCTAEDLAQLDDLDLRASLFSANRALATVAPDFLAHSGLWRDELGALMRSHAGWVIRDRRDHAPAYRQSDIIEHVIDLVLSPPACLSPRKRMSPDSPIADESESARAKQNKH